MASAIPAHKPSIVGIPCDRRTVGLHPFHMAGEKYIAAVRDGAGALPLLIPVLEPSLDIGEILASVDGLLFTGSPSNVAPHRYGGADPRDGAMLDESRDGTTLPLLHAAIAAGVPLLLPLPGLPGTERRVRRHAVSACGGIARPLRSSRRQGCRRSTRNMPLHTT